jgi:hypothetical protein
MVLFPVPSAQITMFFDMGVPQMRLLIAVLAASLAAEPAPATIDSRVPWNHTGIRVRAGTTYVLTAAGTWIDKKYTSGPDGYDSPNLVMKAAEFNRRVRTAKWFALVCALDERASTQFVVGRRVEYAAATGGELTCFANDWMSKYGNNSGSVTLTVMPR